MSTTAMGPGGEFDHIRRALRNAPPPADDVRVAPGDDALVLDPDIVVSTDLSVEGVHFRLDWISPREAGLRATAAALSDLAAMGARTVGVLASVATMGGGELLDELIAGISDEVRARGGTLLGGDLSRSPGPVMVDIVAIGRADPPVLRSGAAPGDELWVTGTLGAAAAAVTLWQGGTVPQADLRRAFTRPVPRIEEARWLVERGFVRAAIDLSDGLAGDCRHLAAASGVGIRLEAHRIPVARAVLAATPFEEEALNLALHGGEDYELLLAAPPGAISPRGVEEFVGRFDLPLTRVGVVTEGDEVVLARGDDLDGRPLARSGYDHFSGGEGG